MRTLIPRDSSQLSQMAATELPDCEGIIVDYLAGTASYLASLPYDLCVTHPNVCSMRNNMEELWRKSTEDYPAELLFNATSSTSVRPS